jgi:hypothetical protein
MTRPRRTLVIAVLGASAVIASLALRCGRSADVAPPPQDATSGAENAPLATSQPTLANAPAPAPPAAQAATPDAAAPAADDTIARALHATDESDRALLSEIERSTHADPAPAVRELLALRHRGASRTELDGFIAQHLHEDLRVRIAAQRWARAVAPLPSDPRQPADTSFGHGGGVQRVKPLAPKSH